MGAMSFQPVRTHSARRDSMQPIAKGTLKLNAQIFIGGLGTGNVSSPGLRLGLDGILSGRITRIGAFQAAVRVDGDHGAAFFARASNAGSRDVFQFDAVG